MLGTVNSVKPLAVKFEAAAQVLQAKLLSSNPELFTKKLIAVTAAPACALASSNLGLKFEFIATPAPVLKAVVNASKLLRPVPLGNVTSNIPKLDVKLVGLALTPLLLAGVSSVTIAAVAATNQPALVTKELVAGSIQAVSNVPTVASNGFVVLQTLKVPSSGIALALVSYRDLTNPNLIVIHPAPVALETNSWYPLTAAIGSVNLGIIIKIPNAVITPKLNHATSNLNLGLAAAELAAKSTSLVANLGIKFTLIDPATPVFVRGLLATPAATLGLKFELATTLLVEVSCVGATSSGILKLTPLILGIPPIVELKANVPSSNGFDPGHISVVTLGVATITSIAATTAYMYTGLEDLNYPVRVQEQVRYPTPTASSFATPTIADLPVYYSHNVFGAMVTKLEPGLTGTAQLSARLYTTLGVTSGDYYSADQVLSPTTVLLFRASSLDTSFVIKSAAGYKAIGPDVTRFTTNYETNIATDFPSSNSMSVSRMASTGTYDLVTGTQYSDGRPLSTSSPNKRLMIASTLVRHNYNQALATTVPVAVATDFNYPTANQVRPTRARIESSVSNTNAVGLSPIYSSNHLTIIDDADYAARASSNAAYGFNAAILGKAPNAGITQHIHSSDSMYSFVPIKSGVKYTFNTSYTALAGNYTVASAAFTLGTGDFAVQLVDADSNVLHPSTILGKLKLRIKITGYRGTSGRNVIIDVPVLGANATDDAFIIDSSYRWFAEQVTAANGTTAAGQFSENTTVSIAVDTKQLVWNQAALDLIVTRPNLLISSLPDSELGGSDQGASQQALLSSTGDRNAIIGEFSVTATRNSQTLQADVAVSTSANTSVNTYQDDDDESPPQARQVGAYNPELLQIIIDQYGDIAGQVADTVNGQPTVSKVIDRMLPVAVKNYTDGGGKYSKVIVGQNAVGLLTTPTSGQSARRLYLWGTNLYGHLVPPSDIYDLFALSGYIANVKEFDIGPSYMCVILDDGTMRCWGNTAAITTANTPKSPWVTDVNDLNANIAGAVGEKFSVINYKGTLKQYGSISQNIPALNGWALPSATAHSQVACGAAHAIALKADGSIACWGNNTYNQCTIPGGAAGTDIVAVAAGHNHSVALLSNGTVVCWGDNAAGQCTVPTSLLAKQITAGGNFTGCLRAAASTDVTVTDGAYSDIEDTFRGWGSNSHYQLTVPLCEGKSYDPTCPHYRMKFYRVVAGYDHVVGIRKVELDLAYLVHPEICQTVNYANIKLPLKTVGNAVIYANVRDLREQYNSGTLVFTQASGTEHWYTVVVVVGADHYRHHLDTTLTEPEQSITIQKQTGGTGAWVDLTFRLTSHDYTGAVVTTDDAFTYVGRLDPCWNGLGSGYPTWSVGMDPYLATYAAPDQYYLTTAVGATGEYIAVDTTPANIYGNSATDEYIVCWGNPMAYDTASSMPEYVSNYGVTAANNSEALLADQITISKATPSYAKRNSFSYLGQSLPHINTISYVGRNEYTSKLTLELTNATTTVPFYDSTTVENIPNAKLYLGPSSAIPIPAGTAFDQHAVWMVSRALTSTSDPEYYLCNCLLPVSASYNADGRDLHVFYSNAGSTEDLTANKVWAARGCVKVRKGPERSFSGVGGVVWDYDYKFQILADDHASITSYNWGTSPTGFWYILNNLQVGTFNTLNNSIPLRHYNLTGASVVDLGGTPTIYFPYETAGFKVPTAGVLSHAELVAKQYYIVRHQTDRYFAASNAKVLQCGKHVTYAPVLNTSDIQRAWNPWGVRFGGQPGTTESTGYLTSSNGFHKAGISGYRSAYLVEAATRLSLYNAGAFHNYLAAKSLGANHYGQLNTPDRLPAFAEEQAMCFTAVSPDPVPVLGATWLMNVGQLTAPTAVAGQVFTKIACGQYHALALDSRGKIYAWGSNARISPGYADVLPWGPAAATNIANDGTTTESPIVSYFANVDTLNTSGATNWPANYITLPEGVAEELQESGSPTLPYPDAPMGWYDITKTTFDVLAGSTYSNTPITNWLVNQVSTYKSGAFKIEIIEPNSGEYRFRVGTDLATTKYTSTIIPNYTPGTRLISWELHSEAAWLAVGTQATTVKVRVNGAYVPWDFLDTAGEPSLSSPIFSNINPDLALGLIGTTVNNFAPTFLRSVGIANVTGAVAGKNFAALILTPDPLVPGNTLSSLRLGGPELTLENQPITDPEFLAISVGATTAENDVCLVIVPRTYDVISARTHSAGSPYTSYNGANSTIADTTFLPCKIWVQEDVSANISPPMVIGDADWPRVVFPYEAQYNNPGTYPYVYDPATVALVRLPDTACGNDQFILRLVDDSPSPGDDGFCIDYVSMKPSSNAGVYSDYIVHATTNDPTLRYVIPQAYGPLVAPAAYTGPVAAARYTSFAVATSTNQLTSWGHNVDHSRSHNVSATYDPYTIPMPTGLIALACNTYEGGVFRGVGLSATGTVHMWGTNTGYHQNYPSQYGGVVGSNKVYITYEHNGTQTPLTGYTKIASVGTNYNFEAYIGINQAGLLDYFRVQVVNVPDNAPGQYFKYLKYVKLETLADFSTSYDSAQFTDYLIPVAIRNIQFTDIQTYSDYYSGHALALSTTGKVYCWGWDPNGYNQVSAFNSRCHAGVATANGDSTPTLAFPSPHTIIQNSASAVTAIAVGNEHSAALFANGRVLIWGYLSEYNSASGYQPDAISANPYNAAGVNPSPKKLGSCKNTFAVITATNTVVAWPAAADVYGTTLTSGITVGAFGTSIISCSPVANHFIIRDNNGAIKCWGAGKRGDITIGNTGQSEVPVDMNASGTWDTYQPTKRFVAIVNPVVGSGVVQNNNQVLVGRNGNTPLIPDNIYATPDNLPITATAAASKLNVIAVAASRNLMFAITTASYPGTSGSLLQWGEQLVLPPTGSTYTKIACSHSQTGQPWSHSVALKTDNQAVTWGRNADTYWATQPLGVVAYSAIACTNTAVAAIKLNGEIITAVHPANSADSVLMLPAIYNNVQFSSVSGGEDHFVARVAAAYNQGNLNLNINDIVAWGYNTYGQCTIPGFAEGNGLSSDHVVAGAHFTAFRRKAIGYDNSIPGVSHALGFTKASLPAIELLEGYMHHSTNALCDQVLQSNHPYYLNPPVQGLARIKLNQSGHTALTGWSTGATNVPADFSSTSTSGRKATHIFADRFKQFRHLKNSNTEHVWGAGYSVFVEDSEPNQIHVFGGKQILNNCALPFVNAAELELYQVPAVSTEGLLVASLNSHRGYVYALDSSGAISPWGYTAGANEYFNISNSEPYKQYLAVPRTSTIDWDVTYYAADSIAASYVTGLPNVSSAWALQVSLVRYLNGVANVLRRFAITGDTASQPIADAYPIHFAEAFMALDTWPATSTALDTYYALNLTTAGGNVKYKVNSASLFAMNLDSKSITGAKILVEAGASPILGDYAIATTNAPLATSNIATSTNLVIPSVVETSGGFDLTYVNDPTYPAYLRNQYGSSARIENIVTANRRLTLAGRIANPSPWIPSGFSSLKGWWKGNDVTSSNTNNGTAITNWPGAAASPALVPVTGGGAVAPIVDNPFTANTRAVRFGGNTVSAATRFIAAYANAAIGQFTYFIVKSNTQTPAGLISNIFTLCTKPNSAVLAQGIGEFAGAPAVVFNTGTDDTVMYHKTNAAVYDANGTPHIVGTYFGAADDYGIRVDGNQAALTAGTATQVYVSQASTTNGYHLCDSMLGTTSGNMNIRDRFMQIAELIVFDSRLSVADMQVVEGYLAWKYGLQATLPNAHPYHTSNASGAPNLDTLTTIAYQTPATTPINYIDIGLAATANPETWLALYSAGAEYLSPKFAVGGAVKEDHAPLIVEFELNQQITTSFIVNVVNCTTTVSAADLIVDPDQIPPPRVVRAVLTCVAGANTFNIVKYKLLGNTTVTAKAAVSTPNLVLSPLRLGLGAAQVKLAFFGGLDCASPYGCTGISTEPPDLIVIKSSLLAPTVAMRASTNNPGLGIKWAIRYLTINSINTVTTANLTGGLRLQPAVPAVQFALNITPVTLTGTYANPMNTGYDLNVACKAKVSTCDARGFIVTRAKTPYSSPIFPTGPDVGIINPGTGSSN